MMLTEHIALQAALAEWRELLIARFSLSWHEQCRLAQKHEFFA